MPFNLLYLIFVYNRDFPNGWPPLQHIIIEGLLKSGLEEARTLAKDIAIRWLRTNYVTYKKTGAMYEKYDVTKCGAYGGGGEYMSQVSAWCNFGTWNILVNKYFD